MNMKSKFIILTILIGVLGSKVLAGKDILPPEIEKNYDGKSSIQGWKLKDQTVYEKKNIAPNAPLYPYHAWILEDDLEWPFHCIFCTEDKKKVSFVMNEWEGNKINPKQYRFKQTSEIGLIKSPYKDSKTGKERGHKFDAWNGTKFRNPMPKGLPLNKFPIIFESVENISEAHK